MSNTITPRPLTDDDKEAIVDLYAPGDRHADIELVAREECDSGRWHQHIVAVFKMDGSEQLFGLGYERGLTEGQEGGYPGLYSGNHDQFQPFKMKAVTKTITTYEGDE